MDLLDDRKRQVVTAGETRAVVCDRPSVAGVCDPARLLLLRLAGRALPIADALHLVHGP